MSTPFCFIHAADLHLDSPFEGIGRTAPQIAAALQEASLKAFDRIVELAIERNAAFLLLAGDIYDGPERGLRAQIRFLNGIERLQQAGIRVFAVNGNHDALSNWSAARSTPANLTIFGSEEVQWQAVERGGECLANVYGISYASPGVTENLSLRFQRQDSPGLHIGLLHCRAGASDSAGAYSSCSIKDLAASGMDYWALGHIHEHRIVAQGKPWIVYPGTPQGRGTRAGEWWAKGVVAVEVDEESAIRSVDFVAVDSVRTTEARLDIANVADAASLEKSILAQVRDLRENQQGRDLVVRVVLEGRGQLHEDLQITGRMEDLLADLRMLVADESPFLWFDQIVDETRGVTDRDQIAQRGDFSSDVLRQSEDLQANPERLRDLLTESLEPLRAPRVRRWIDPDQWDPLTLLREAEQRALDLVESGEPQ